MPKTTIRAARNKHQNATVQALLRALDEAYDRTAWHGPNLRSALRGVTARVAAWRPARGAHSIWELTLHAAYWTYRVRQRICGESRGKFPAAGSNWFKQPEHCTEAAWMATRVLLEQQHRLLRGTVARCAPAELSRLVQRRWSAADNILGVAFHDVYHAGQIQLLKRLQSRRGGR